MFNRLTYIPVTEDSRPFASAAEVCSFDERGYAEDEYFMSGTANVYQEGANGKPEVIFAGAPYTTRLLVRRPKDTAKFSGNIVLEILNSSAGIDIDRMWVNSWQYFTRNGDIYIGITSKGHVVDSLLRFDAKRYAQINWANPMPERTPPANASPEGIFRFLPQFEQGLFWDMLTDCAELFKNDGPDNPLSEYPGKHLFLTGWSQSGFYIARYLHSFYNPEKPVFDGYLSAGSWAGKMQLNAYETGAAFRTEGVPQASVMGAAQPVIAVNTESENRSVYWHGDFDEPGFKFRTYQIPASSHDTKYNLLDYYGDKGLAELDAIGIFNGYAGVDGGPMDYPYEVIFNAAFHHLYAWARQGIPAPHAPKIETQIVFAQSTDPMGSWADNVKDVFGNCKGGIRTPAADYPTARYTSFSVNKDGITNPMFGKVNPFSAEQLRLMYGSLDHYRALVSEGTDKAVALGFILEEDKEAFVDRVVEAARKRGLN